MSVFLEIISVHGREILDSRGNPTVAAQVRVRDEKGEIYSGSAAVPSGASTGRFEAVELRDAENRYFGLGVTHAAENIDGKIAPLLLGKNALEQIVIDKILVEADGTENKANLGANAGCVTCLCQSCRCGTASAPVPLSWRYSHPSDADSHDEYSEWRKACCKYGGFSGIYDYARKGGKLP